jgi:hypothetical protein
MRPQTRLLLAALGILAAGPALAQSEPDFAAAPRDTAKAAGAAERTASMLPPIAIQHIRPGDQRGLNVFEAPKDDAVPYTGFRLDWSAAFTQQFQALSHDNSAAAVTRKDAAGKDYNANQLMDIGAGFNLATANLGLNAQLAPGIRVSLEAYLSSRHHQEAWVKGGYLQVDESPIDHPLLNAVMEVVTIKAGMFPLNYGDAHFRRSDNGNAIYNPFIGNYVLDAWTFEPGAEIYVRRNGFLGMVGVTSGLNKGDVTKPDSRGFAYLGKVGFDRQLNPDLRVRLTGSYYNVDKTPTATLFAGDRAGSRYYMVLENTVATTSAQFTSGSINPLFTNQLRAFQVNPFVKLRGLELFGVAERAEGKAAAEAETRVFEQYAGDVVYRFLPGEKLFVGARYNTVSGELPISGRSYDVSIGRTALGAGWFVTPTVLVKGEYVRQQYEGFPTTDIRNGGKFNGFVVEGVVSF